MKKDPSNPQTGACFFQQKGCRPLSAKPSKLLRTIFVLSLPTSNKKMLGKKGYVQVSVASNQAF